MRIFSGSIDKKLENIYIPKLIANGNTKSDSKKILLRLLRIAKKESRLEGGVNPYGLVAKLPIILYNNS